MWGLTAFADREEAGRRLAERLSPKIDPADAVVLALPRGGVPVAFQVTEATGAPLDVLLVRKLGVPWHPELAFGAVSTGGVVVIDDDVVGQLGIASEEIEGVLERELEELDRRGKVYRGGRAPLEVDGKTVVVIDDGIATGSTVRAALKALEQRGASRTIVAVPVAPSETVQALGREADEVVCLETPRDFVAIGHWYRDFSPVPDEVVLELLERSVSG